MIGEAEVADAPGFALLHQKIEQIIVDKALHESGKPLADAYDVQQIVVDVVGLQFHKRIAIHFHRGVEQLLRRQPFARHAMVRHLGGYIIGVAGVALQRDSGCLFRQSAAIRRSGVEIVDAVLYCVVNEVVDSLLVDDFAVVALFCGPSHTAISENRHLLPGFGVGAIGHLVGRHLALSREATGDAVPLAVAACKHRSGGCSADSEAFEKLAAV